MSHQQNRRQFIGTLAATSCLGIMPLIAKAETFPSKPITIVVASAPGGIIDIVARTLGDAIAENLKVSVIVENKPGGGGHIGSSYVAKAKPDGYTLLSTSGATLTSGVVQNLKYDPVNDLVPVARVLTTPVYLVVAADSPYKSIDDLIQDAKKRPGEVFFGTTNTGNSTHIAAELLNMRAGIQTVHVPYKGSGPALQDLIGGQIQFMFDTRPSIVPLAEGGKLRILGVTSEARETLFPDVPTVSETLPDFVIEGWGGLFAPAKTPIDILQKLAEAQLSAINSEEFAKRLKIAGTVAYLPPEPARAYMLEDHKRVSAVVKAANIQIN